MTRPNKPALPRPASEYTRQGTLADGNDAEEAQVGLTIREDFAARIMAGFAAYHGYALRNESNPSAALIPEFAASHAVLWADALIARLNETGNASTPTKES